jgi:Flp pilus assembly protein TadD
MATRGQFDEAIEWYHKALQYDPDYTGALSNLGASLARSGRNEEAIASFQKALEIDGDFADAHYNLGLVYVGQKDRLDDAIAEFRKAASIRTDCDAMYHSLGLALERRGNIQEAVASYRSALALKPNNLDVLNNLARLLATCPDASIRNGAEAVRFAERAVELSRGEDAAILDTLAAAYAEAGRFADAVRTAQKAINLSIQKDQPAAADAVRTRLILYQSGKPFRETRPPLESPAAQQ